MTGLMRGNVALMGKIFILAIITAILSLLTVHAFAQKEYAIGSFILFAILALNFTYLTKFSIPLKFFVPGILFFIAFVIAPIIFTLIMSTYHYQTGNILGKDEATAQVLTLGAEPDAAGTTFDIFIGKTSSGDDAILVSDIANNQYFISTKTSRTEVPVSALTLNADKVATGAQGFTALSADALSNSDVYSKINYTYKGKYYIAIEGQNVGAVFQQSLAFDATTKTIKNVVTGAIYKDNGRGNWAKVGAPDEMLTPGWRAPIWFENYTKLLTDPKVRTPLIKVFIWTVVFAGMSVLSTFALGLLLALALNRKLRGRRIYRSILILPYAMPSVMSILIWAGMFDTEFGAINNLLHTHIAWFSDANYARGAARVA